MGVGHPFDTLKVLLQTQSSVNPKYSGMMDCVRQVVKADGLSGLYKGYKSPLFGQIIINSWQFGVWGQTLKLFKTETKPQLTTLEFIQAGAITGFFVAFAESPIDFFKTQIQIQPKENPRFTSLQHVISHVTKEHGIRGWYQGLSATVIRNVPAQAVYFGGYEWAKGVQRQPGQTDRDLSTPQLLAAGSFGGLLYWSLTFPLDCIKSKMQADSVVPHERVYKSFAGTAAKMMRDDGMKAFFKGYTPCVLRSMPANSACFFGYEVTKNGFRSWGF